MEEDGYKREERRGTDAKGEDACARADDKETGH
jgi:hypothetical protein